MEIGGRLSGSSVLFYRVLILLKNKYTMSYTWKTKMSPHHVIFTSCKLFNIPNKCILFWSIFCIPNRCFKTWRICICWYRNNNFYIISCRSPFKLSFGLFFNFFYHFFNKLHTLMRYSTLDPA